MWEWVLVLLVLTAVFLIYVWSQTRRTPIEEICGFMGIYYTNVLRMYVGLGLRRCQEDEAGFEELQFWDKFLDKCVLWHDEEDVGYVCTGLFRPWGPQVREPQRECREPGRVVLRVVAGAGGSDSL